MLYFQFKNLFLLCLPEAVLFVFGWLCLSITLMTSLLASSMKNGLMFLPYFVCGVSAANCLEVLHYARFAFRKRCSDPTQGLWELFGLQLPSRALSSSATATTTATADVAGLKRIRSLLFWCYRFVPDGKVISRQLSNIFQLLTFSLAFFTFKFYCSNKSTNFHFFFFALIKIYLLWYILIKLHHIFFFSL